MEYVLHSDLPTEACYNNVFNNLPLDPLEFGWTLHKGISRIGKCLFYEYTAEWGYDILLHENHKLHLGRSRWGIQWPVLRARPLERAQQWNKFYVFWLVVIVRRTLGLIAGLYLGIVPWSGLLYGTSVTRWLRPAQNRVPFFGSTSPRCPLPAARSPLPVARCPLPAARCPLPARIVRCSLRSRIGGK
eukprot:jgi/Mesvir1/5404/Mv25556-RA.1